MLALGRGLMALPTPLLLDEPSVGLAPLIVREIFAAIAALRFADRGYVLESGRVALAGAADQLMADPATIHAICEDYWAGATIDLDHDRADREEGRRLAAPALCLWQQPRGFDLPFDPLAVWRRWSDDVAGQPLPGGHFLPEECPAVVVEAFLAFFA